ncbi:Nucleotide-binding protein [bacterium HR19]|nr:Nucleotide-binding protein [bacterium HR19]
MRILFITGISGSGKTTVLKSLEDIGYYPVDNIPVEMIYDFLNLAQKANINKVALSLFFKDKEVVKKFLDLREKLKSDMKDSEIYLVFLDASDDAILRRYKETRRKHPLSDIATSTSDAIRKEREILQSIQEVADIKIDSTNMNIHELREKVKSIFGDEKAEDFFVQIYSFGFRYGIPQESDMVFDVRFIRNPNFDPELKKFDGTKKEVQDYIFQDENARKYLEMMKDMLKFLIERFKKEGKHFATISVGCTGGRHRSVAFAEKLKELIEKESKVKVIVTHRDKDKDPVI